MNVMENVTKNETKPDVRVFPVNPIMQIARWALDTHLSNLVNYWGRETVREFVKQYFTLAEPGGSSQPRSLDEYPLSFDDDRKLF
jgi:hypothetical protein